MTVEGLVNTIVLWSNLAHRKDSLIFLNESMRVSEGQVSMSTSIIFPVNRPLPWSVWPAVTCETDRRLL